MFAKVLYLFYSKATDSRFEMQNLSHAVMAQRHEGKESLDSFPTPPWATRAFLEYTLGGKEELSKLSCLEPACGHGHMSKVLGEYFSKVDSSDIYDYGYGEIIDFTKRFYAPDSYDWVITNPPFKLAETFIDEALKVSRRGVAMLTRTVFIESKGRYERLFSQNPPSSFAQYVERVPMVKGRLDRKASTATGYGWLIWDKNKLGKSALEWIPPSRKQFERDSDYEQPESVVELNIPLKRVSGDLFS